MYLYREKERCRQLSHTFKDAILVEDTSNDSIQSKSSNHDMYLKNMIGTKIAVTHLWCH